MKTFTDTAKRDWAIEVNVASVKRVRDALGVNLLGVVERESDILTRLYTDPIFLCDVLYVLCKPQADERTITDEQFGQSLSGDVIDAAAKGLLEEIADFFPQSRRAVVRKINGKVDQLIRGAFDRAGAMVDAIDVDAAINAGMAKSGTSTVGELLAASE